MLFAEISQNIGISSAIYDVLCLDFKFSEAQKAIGLSTFLGIYLNFLFSYNNCIRSASWRININNKIVKAQRDEPP